MSRTLAKSRATCGLTLDAGALIELERGDAHVRALLTAALAAGAKLAVPAGVIAQSWRGGTRAARIARLLADDQVDTVVLDGPTAKAVVDTAESDQPDGAASWTLFPFRKVPFVLPRSRSVKRPPANVTEACWRQTPRPSRGYQPPGRSPEHELRDQVGAAGSYQAKLDLR